MAPSGNDRLMASWRRSEDYGVSTESVEPVFAGTDTGDDSLFIACGQEVLAGLHQTLANEPLSLMLTDADGLVLNRFSGDTGLLRALDDVHLAPGFTYAERHVGTNGLGLALADRVPTVVRADEHFSASLRTYTCAAAPVLDPMTGRLEGAVNITTWSRSSSDLLLALAQSAAGNTSALMLARSRGRTVEPPPRGRITRVRTSRLEPGSGTLADLSPAWTDAADRAVAALRTGRVVLAVGEAGSGRATLMAQALRRTRPRDRILGAAAPAPQDVRTWLRVWVPELAADHTCVVVSGVDALPAWAAEEVAERLRLVRAAGRDRGEPAPGHGLLWSVTAEAYADLAGPLAALVDTVVEVPPLRDRNGDVMALTRHAAYQVRGREVDFTRAAEHALESYGWPGNVTELFDVVRAAAARTDRVDVPHLPGEVLSGSSHRLTRLEVLERDEILRCLSRPGATVRQAGAELGLSRATMYRKVAAYGIRLPL